MNHQPLRTDDEIGDVLDKYSDMVYKIALSQTKSSINAEDIFQEVFLRYVQSDTEFESEEHRKAWLTRVSVNCCKKFWNSAWLRHTILLDEKVTDATENSFTFDAAKWRSGDGAYMILGCKAVKNETGWSYTVGAAAIS